MTENNSCAIAEILSTDVLNMDMSITNKNCLDLKTQPVLDGAHPEDHSTNIHIFREIVLSQQSHGLQNIIAIWKYLQFVFHTLHFSCLTSAMRVIARAIGNIEASCIWTLHFRIFSCFDLPFGLVVARLIGGEICELHLAPCSFAVLHSFCMFRPALGGWWGEQLVTRERPHSSGREGEGEEGSSRKSKRFKGTGGPEVLWRQLTLCGAASLPPIFGGCSSDLSQEERWTIKDPQTFDPSFQKHKRFSIQVLLNIHGCNRPSSR